MSQFVNFGKPFRVQTTQRDQQAVKKIVEPFLQWYNDLFSFSEETIKKLTENSKLIEYSVDINGGFKVNEETLLSILSAELQGSSKVQSLHTIKMLPTIPTSIADQMNLQDETYSNKLNKSCKEVRNSKSIVTRMRFIKAPRNIDMKEYLMSNDFVHTENLCQDLELFL